MTGECNTNPNAKWLDVLAAGETPELEIMWSIQDPTGPKIALDEVNKKITISDLTPEQGCASVTISNGKETHDIGGASDTVWDDANWNAETSSGEFVLTYADWWKDVFMKDKLVTITLGLTDGSSRSVTIIGQ